MSRAPIPLAVAVVATLALAGCGNVDADAVQAEFAGRAGVIEVWTSCTQSLPLAYSCEVTVSVERDITVAQLVEILPLMRTGLHGAERSAIVVEAGTSHYPDLEIRFASDGSLAPGVSDKAVAQAFVEGIADPRVDEFVLDEFSPASEGPLATITYDDDDDAEPASEAAGTSDSQNETAITSMRRIQELLPGASVEVNTPDLAIDAPEGSAPDAELELYLGIVGAFPVQHAQVEPGLLQVRLPEGTDTGPATEFAEQQPQYASIDFVAITSDGSLSASDINPEFASDFDAVIEAASALPQYTAASVQYNKVTFTVSGPAVARDIDAALASLPEYQRVAVSYSSTDMEVARDPGGVLAVDQVISLAADPSVAYVEITPNTAREGSLAVEVEGVDNADPYDLGLALARSGVDELPGAWILVFVRHDVRWSLDFYLDEPLRLETGRTLTDEQVADFTRGWETGR